MNFNWQHSSFLWKSPPRFHSMYQLKCWSYLRVCNFTWKKKSGRWIRCNVWRCSTLSCSLCSAFSIRIKNPRLECLNQNTWRASSMSWCIIHPNLKSGSVHFHYLVDFEESFRQLLCKEARPWQLQGMMCCSLEGLQSGPLDLFLPVLPSRHVARWHYLQTLCELSARLKSGQELGEWSQSALKNE